MSKLNQKMAEAAARSEAARRKALVITAAVMLPLGIVTIIAATALNIYYDVKVWALLLGIPGGVIYAIALSVLDPD